MREVEEARGVVEEFERLFSKVVEGQRLSYDEVNDLAKALDYLDETYWDYLHFGVGNRSVIDYLNNHIGVKYMWCSRYHYTPPHQVPMDVWGFGCTETSETAQEPERMTVGLAARGEEVKMGGEAYDTSTIVLHNLSNEALGGRIAFLSGGEAGRVLKVLDQIFGPDTDTNWLCMSAWLRGQGEVEVVKCSRLDAVATRYIIATPKYVYMLSKEGDLITETITEGEYTDNTIVNFVRMLFNTVHGA